MQAILMDQLKAEYPGAKVAREVEGIDVVVETESTRTLYEIKIGSFSALGLKAGDWPTPRDALTLGTPPVTT